MRVFKASLNRGSLLMLGVAALLGSGCFTTQSIPVEDRTRVYEAEYDQVFAAVVSVLTANGYVLKTVDPDIGLLDTDYLHRSGFSLLGKQRRKVNVLFKDEQRGVRVTLTVAAEEPNDEGDWQGQPLTEKYARKYYSDLFADIRSELF